MTFAASIGDELTDFFGDAIMVVVKMLIFLAIMAVGWFVARWLYRWASTMLTRVGLDRAVDRGGLRRVMGGWSASDLTARILQYALLLVTLQLALGVFGQNPVTDLINDIVAWLPQLFIAILIVVVAAAIAGAVKDVITRALHGLSYGRALGTAAQVGIIALGLIAALNQVGIGTSVTMPVLIAVLATVGGILVVGVGGGMIKPMQGRWERMLTRAESETATAGEQVRTNRAAEADRMRKPPGGFSQPAYGGGSTVYGTPNAYGAQAANNIPPAYGGSDPHDTQIIPPGARPPGTPPPQGG
ncbi:hypothetical protein GCM10009682_36630 [Luedemannella flava]|uniref:Uncharacterized protein n=1 Tax=Luedemannella flava TaxID=349316 RepID=A0ABN2M7H6_9ACTN